MKQTKTITVLRTDLPTYGPQPLKEFTETLKTAIAEVPAAHRGSIMIEFGIRDDYGDAQYPTMELTYEREETDAEEATRETEAERKRRAYEIQQRQEYERLRKKFEG